MTTAPTKSKTRRVHSIKDQLVIKAREAALSAVQTFNNPLIQFKSETFIVQMTIAWTYLLHAHCRKNKVEYRYYETLPSGRKKFSKTKRGSHKFWELERCLNDPGSPLDGPTASNLRFLIGLRHEIEHQMSMSLDDYLSGRYQACALNFNRYIKQLFGERYALDAQLAFSIQFAELALDQIEDMTKHDDIPDRVKAYIADFDDGVPDADFQSPHYSYRVLFTRKLTGKKGQADRAIEFIAADSPLAEAIDKQYWVQKEVEKPKFKAGAVVRAMQAEGYKKFNMHHHTMLWKQLDAKNPGKGFGVDVDGSWFWYERWIDQVRSHCRDNGAAYALRSTPPAATAAAPTAAVVTAGVDGGAVPEHLRRPTTGQSTASTQD